MKRRIVAPFLVVLFIFIALTYLAVIIHFPLNHPNSVYAQTMWTLTVASAHDTSVPGVGNTTYADGSLVTCSVTSPVTEGSTVWTCTGWTGTGSVPSSGSGTSTTFTISMDSTITWNWQGAPVQWTLTVASSPSSHDTPSPSVGDHLYNDGSLVTCSVTSPVTEGSTVWTCIGWTGAGSVPSGSGSSTNFTITQNSSITWNWGSAPVQWMLTVASPHDSPSPGVGTHTYSDGSSVTCSVSSPVVDGGRSYTCTGWTGTGSVASSGSGTSTGQFTITSNSSITWNWELTPRTLTVVSAYGSPSPAVGTHTYSDGDSVTCTVSSPVNESGRSYTCTGWTGTGSVPASGASTSAGPFTITVDSSITWNWKTQYLLSVSSAYDTPGGGGWYDSGSTAYATLSSGTVSGGAGAQYVFTSWSGDASGTGLTSNAITMSGPMTATANWKTQYLLSVSSAYDTPGGGGWYDSGSTAYATLSSGTVSGGAGTQYVFTSWGTDASGTNYVQSNAITMNAAKTATANWKTQYLLTVTSPYDSPSPMSGWFDSGSSVTESVTSPTPGPSGTRYVCTGWFGSGSVPESGTSLSVLFTMSGASSITWNWKTQYQVTFDQTGVSSDFPGTVVTIDSVNYGVSSLPVSFWYDGSSSHSFSFPSPLVVGVKQYVWGSTSGLSNLQSGTLTVTASGMVVGNYQVQNQVTFDEVGVSLDFRGTVVIIDSVSYSKMQLPVSFSWTVGSSHSFAFQSPLVIGSTTEQTVWTSTTGLSSAQSGSTTVTTYGSIIGQYKTQYYLTVSSPNDSPSPASGWFDSGSGITESVTSPVSGGAGTQYVCTGWTGTGSVPTSGSSSSVTFTITQASSITWNWQVAQHSLTVYSAHDTPNPANGVNYFNDGSNVTVGVSSPVTENGTLWICTGWTGTGSVPSSGTDTSVTFVISQNSSITWNWHSTAVQQYKLTVISAHGNPSPAVGDRLFDYNDSITCSVVTPVTDSGVTYACIGWTGSGSVPSTGSRSSVTFTILQNSTITWNWQVVQWTLTVSSPHGSPVPDVGDHTFSDSSSVTCNVSSPVTEAGVSYTCTGWTGTGSVQSSGSGTSTTFIITENSTITWNWVVTSSVQWNLVVSSAHGNPSPSVGDHLYGDDSSVTCSVVSPVNESGTVWTCTGWTGTGSVPSSGSDVSVTFSITENSSIIWNWVAASSVQWKLTVVSAHGSPSPSVGDHLYSDRATLACSVSSAVVENGVSYVCSGWTGTGSVSPGGVGTSTSFTITENSTITWNWQVRTGPTIEGCDNTGAKKDVFSSDETVYITGLGYAENQTFSLYFVNETTWINGMAIPERVQGTATSVSSDSSGNIHATIVWNEPLTTGNYDILVDVNGTGKYDAQVDPLNSIQIVPPAELFLIPEYVFGTILGLTGCFAALGAFRIYKRKSL